MTPEEAFLLWFDHVFCEEYKPTSWEGEGYKLAWLEAWKQGHHQGMTRAAEICEREMKCYEIYSSTHFGEPKKHYEACMTAILTERDREEK